MEEKELNLNSTESIPKQFVERAKNSLKNPKEDPITGDYVKDSEGKYVYEVNSKGVKEAIKSFARHFADFGVDINEINFDDYLVEGIILDKIPKNALTVIEITDGNHWNPNSNFYVFDKRKDSGRDNPLWESGYRTMYHSKKGRRVDVGRIPDYQFLQAAKNIWVIPEEIIKRDVSAVRAERRQRTTADQYTRYKELPHSYWGRDNRTLDKSGYIIDPDQIEKKLKDFRKKKELESAGGSYSALAENTVKTLVDKYNKMVIFLLKVAQSQLQKGKLSVNLGLIDQLNTELNRRITYLINSIEFAEKGNTYSFDRNLNDLKNIENTSNWSDLVNSYQRALDTEEVSVATEGRGCKYNTVLQATEGLLLDKDLVAAFEEVL